VSDLLTYLRSLLERRPAESLGAGTGLLAVAALQVFGTDVPATPQLLIALVALLPAVVSTVVTRSRRPRGHLPGRGHEELESELEHLAIRAVRRARLGDPSWRDDLKAVESIWKQHPAHPTAVAGEQTPNAEPAGKAG
jgi:hypothetical protein